MFVLDSENFVRIFPDFFTESVELLPPCCRITLVALGSCLGDRRQARRAG